jgi:hypothetical protein
MALLKNTDFEGGALAERLEPPGRRVRRNLSDRTKEKGPMRIGLFSLFGACGDGCPEAVIAL